MGNGGGRSSSVSVVIRLIQDPWFERAAFQGGTIFQAGPSRAAGILIEETTSDKVCRKSCRTITFLNLGDWVPRSRSFDVAVKL